LRYLLISGGVIKPCSVNLKIH